jgi:sugar phosphate isomerase/epimerase
LACQYGSEYRAVSELEIGDIELTLQENEFRLGFDRSLRMPLYHDLVEMVQEGVLSIRSIHAPNMNAEHGHSMGARLEYLWQTLEKGCSLGAKVIVAHPFHLFTSYEAAVDYIGGNFADLEQALLPGLRSLLDRADGYDMIVSLENVKIWADDGKDYFNRPENISRFLTDLAHPAMGVTLDIIHARLIGSVNDFLEKLEGRIVNLHLADLELPARRVPPGEGVIDWMDLLPVFARLPNLRQLTVELTQASQEEVKRSVDRLTEWWQKNI